MADVDDELASRRVRLRRDLDRWVGAGLIQPAQADAIVAFDQPVPGSDAGPARDAAVPTGIRSSRAARVAEIAGYLGATLAAVAAGFAVASFWADLETWSRLLLVGAGTLLVVAGAAWISASREPPVVRLANVLWVAAVGGLGAWLALAGADGLSMAAKNVVLLTGAGALLPATALLAWRQSVLQHLACFGAAAATVIGLVVQYEHAEADTVGFALWGLGVCWLLLSWGSIVPHQRAGFAMGCITVLVGAQLITSVVKTPGILLGLCSAVAVLVAAVPLRSRVMLGLGVPGLVLFSAQAIAHFVHVRPGEARGGSLMLTLGLVIAGVAITAAALGSAHRHGGPSDTDARSSEHYAH